MTAYNQISEGKADTSDEGFVSALYSTAVSAVTYALPVLVLPLALPIACLKTCISRQCCVPRSVKQNCLIKFYDTFTKNQAKKNPVSSQELVLPSEG